MSGIRREDYWQKQRWEDSQLPAWKQRRQSRLAVQFYGALCAHGWGNDQPEILPSLATCKSSPRSEQSSGTGPLTSVCDLSPTEYKALSIVFRLGVDSIERAVGLVRGGGDRVTALYRVFGRSRERIEKVLALLERDEVGHAMRLATCGERSVQLECPTDAGGCGSDDNYVPIHCGSRLCSDCMNRRIGQLVERWGSVVRSMSHPTFATFTIENVGDPARGRDTIVNSFARLRRRTIPFEGETVRKGSKKAWRWWVDGGQPADLWKVRLQEAGAHDLVRYLQRSFVDYEYENATGSHRGRAIPFDELVDGGLYSVDIKQKSSGEFNVHLHAVLDMAYIPQAALSSVWEDLTGDPVVDIRRVYGRDDGKLEAALLETVAYATKSPDFETIEDEVEFVTAMKGKALVHPFGMLHGTASDLGGLLCCSACDSSPFWWNYCGLVDERVDNMGKSWDCNRGKDPP